MRRRNEKDKKVRSILCIALGAEGRKVFPQKKPRAKNLSISFIEFSILWSHHLLSQRTIRLKRTSYEPKTEGQRVQRIILGSTLGSGEIEVNAEQE